MGEVIKKLATAKHRYEAGPSIILPSIPSCFKIGRTKYKLDDPVIPKTVQAIAPSVILDFQLGLSLVVHFQKLFEIELEKRCKFTLRRCRQICEFDSIMSII